MDFLKSIDIQLFYFFNDTFTHPIFDPFFAGITDIHKTKVFLAIVIALIGYWAFKEKKKMALPLLFILLSVGLSDLFTYRVLKKNIYRERPSHSQEVASILRVGKPAGDLSFPSNHSANSFALALALTLVFPVGKIYFYIFAGLIAWSRVYVGVHYPFDVLVGALVGTSCAWVIFKCFRGKVRTADYSSSAAPAS